MARRNQIKFLIRKARRDFFTDSVINTKDPKFIWKHLRAANGKGQTSSNKLPSELRINYESITDTEVIATKLNTYMSSISQFMHDFHDDFDTVESDKLRNYANSTIPHNVSSKFHLSPVKKFYLLSTSSTQPKQLVSTVLFLRSLN